MRKSERARQRLFLIGDPSAWKAILMQPPSCHQLHVFSSEHEELFSRYNRDGQRSCSLLQQL
jgi:hypothetical protein